MEGRAGAAATQGHPLGVRAGWLGSATRDRAAAEGPLSGALCSTRPPVAGVVLPKPNRQESCPTERSSSEQSLGRACLGCQHAPAFTRHAPWRCFNKQSPQERLRRTMSPEKRNTEAKHRVGRVCLIWSHFLPVAGPGVTQISGDQALVPMPGPGPEASAPLSRAPASPLPSPPEADMKGQGGALRK